MKNFTRIEATFEMFNPRLNQTVIAKVERLQSPCFNYGNRSSHSVVYYDKETGKDYDDKFFDTRYHRIPLDKEKWSAWWIENLFEYNGFKGVKLTTFKSWKETMED